MLNVYLKECLYFTSSRFTRIITKMAEEEFTRSGLSPTAAYLLMVLYENQGLSQKEIGEILHLRPSTVTRICEKLKMKGLVYNKVEGRTSYIYTTEEGKELEATIYDCWMRLRDRYAEILGRETADELSVQLERMSDELEKL
ncbi:MarR family winged helix-turn-helix transcriptional regulator [Gracilibacillus sp. HCP3S3_G5_1]|uniref:MarR family winged helix-turn-helix transcriptional regulator n=1 Tax=unclassified Gracilibacillus TaxID=2625209 RepID=UPI003F89A3A2